MSKREHTRLQELSEDNQRIEEEIQSLQATRDSLREKLDTLALTPRARRSLVRWLMQEHGMSERRACELVGVHRSTVRYHPQSEEEGFPRGRRRPIEAPILEWLSELSFEVRYRPPRGRRAQTYRLRFDIE